ncbi:putative serine/threonine-protein kinase 31-like isoform X2 [Apostichopus japonicus]|uniref:Putative serine/threonine-protein kinase 31-like isoform X2 n=1 Tax=Stichopus japonicus TaxID=307972 RepID=A0A2G8LGU1_STIJA|nr:putative serine/threonine-protein kinase 31-like isoform X2 [Apostichopus japonicus]
MASKPNNSRDVFVGSLPDDADEATISDIFSVVGDVQSVTIKEGKNNMSKFCNKMEGGVMRPPEARNFPVSVQRRSPQIGYGNRPWAMLVMIEKGQGCGKREQLCALLRLSSSINQLHVMETIAVTHVVDSTTFFAQICNAETATAYQTMINQLFEHCAYGPTPATEIQPNHVYGAIFSVDNGWYRCTVKGTDPTTGKVTVGFVDYGNEETVDAVVELPPALASVPFFAIQMSLYGLESAFPINHQKMLRSMKENVKQARAAFEYLSKLPEADKVTVRISNQQQRPQEYSVVVFLDGQNVNEIIQNNFADKRPSPAMSPVQQVQQLQQDVGGGGHYSTGRPSQLPQRNWNAPSPSGSNDSTAALVAQLQNEKANLIQKVHEMKMDMQVLGSTKEIEVNSYKEKVDFAIDYKVATVLGSLRRVKKARSLYPADDNQKAPLENAIDIIHGGEITLNGEKKTFRDATPKSNSVEEKLEVLNQWQDMIRSCSNKEELAQLVEKRNSARHESYQAMTDFLKVSDELPVGERLAALQDLKMKKLRSYWKETDEALSSWEHILSDMTQAFCFSSCSEFEAKNLDASIQQLLVAMETELVVSCQGYEPHIPLNPEILKQRQAELQLENEVLTKTVQMVFRDINEEAALLDQLSTHCKRYKEEDEGAGGVAGRHAQCR